MLLLGIRRVDPIDKVRILENDHFIEPGSHFTGQQSLAFIVDSQGLQDYPGKHLLLSFLSAVPD